MLIPNSVRPHSFMNSLASVRLGGKPLGLDNLNLVFPGEVEVELLKIGSKGWQKGKIRIKCGLKRVVNYRNEYDIQSQVDIEFSPDEPPQPESPLDDLRELPKYKQQL